MTVENKDVIGVEDTPANLTTNLKDKMDGFDITNDRFAHKKSGTMFFVSNDLKQALLATVQTLSGAKTFAAITNFTLLAKFNEAIALKSKDQTITTDNDTLLDVSNTSFLRVATSTTSTPTNFTVGMEAGQSDGHLVHIVIKNDLSALEIDDSVAGSASIITKTGFPTSTTPLVLQDTTAGAPRSRSFIWNSAASIWYEL